MSLGTSSSASSPLGVSVTRRDSSEQRSSAAPTIANGLGTYSIGQKRKRNKPTLNCGVCVDRKVSTLAVDICSKAEGNSDRQNVTERSQNAGPVSDVARRASIKKGQHPLEKARSHSGPDQNQLTVASRYVVLHFNPSKRRGKRHDRRSRLSAALVSAALSSTSIRVFSFDRSRMSSGSKALY